MQVSPLPSVVVNPFRILQCDDCPSPEAIRYMVSSHLPDSQVVQVDIAYDSGELLRRLAEERFNLCIITVNNVRFPMRNSPPENRIRLAIKLLSVIRAVYDTPMIVLTGYPGEADHVEQLRATGADAVLRLPFSKEEFAEAFRLCSGV